MLVRILKVNFTTHKRKMLLLPPVLLGVSCVAADVAVAVADAAIVGWLPAAAAVVVFALFLAHSAFWFCACVRACVCEHV